MKRNVLLLLDVDTDTSTAVLSAAQIVGLEVRVGQIRHDLSELTEYELDDVAAIILDCDLHAPEIAQELPYWVPPRPLIVISTELAVAYPLTHEGPPTQHLAKPVNVIQLVRVLDEILEKPTAVSCDRWGHPHYEALVE